MDLHTSLRRTIVPMIMGWIGSLPISQIIDIQAVEGIIVVTIGAVYYTTLRWFEERGYRFAGWWLAFGKVSAPTYPGMAKISKAARLRAECAAGDIDACHELYWESDDPDDEAFAWVQIDKLTHEE